MNPTMLEEIVAAAKAQARYVFWRGLVRDVLLLVLILLAIGLAVKALLS